MFLPILTIFGSNVVALIFVTVIFFTYLRNYIQYTASRTFSGGGGGGGERRGLLLKIRQRMPAFINSLIGFLPKECG